MTPERVEAVITMQRHGKHVSAATDTDATIEDPVLSVWSAPSLYGVDQLEKLVSRWSELAVSSLELQC
jgi:hypothetical protein